MSGGRDSNPRPSRWQRDALPTELPPLKSQLYTNHTARGGLEWVLMLKYNYYIGGSFKGRTRDFGSRYLGSNPSPPALRQAQGYSPWDWRRF